MGAQDVGDRTRAARAGRALLVDLDGTLLDANLSIRQTMNQVLAERGQPTFSRAELEALIGHPLREILAHKATDPSLVEPMALRYREVYNESGWVTCGPFPGMPQAIAQARADGWATGVVTSKGEQEAETVLFDLGLLDLFDAVVGDDDVRPLKPNPDPVLEAARRVGVEPANCAMVGDTLFDVRSARAAGAFAVGVLWGNGSRESLLEAGAQALARDPRELCAVLARWAKA